MGTAVTALSLAATGFVVPFMFIYGPPLLLDGSFPAIVVSFVTGAIGVCALAGAVIGYVRAHVKVPERLLLAVAAVCLIGSGIQTDLVGILILGLLAFRWRTPRGELTEIS